MAGGPPPQTVSAPDFDAGDSLAHAGQAVIVTDSARRITVWNDAAERLYGWAAAEALGRSILDVIPAEPAASGELLTAVEDGGSWAGEHLVRGKDGVPFPAFVTITPIRDSGGALRGVLGLSFALPPAADRRGRAFAAWEALAERRLYYDTLFQAMSEGFALCEAIRDGDGRLVDYVILEMNPALQRMLGVGPEAVGGRFTDGQTDLGGWRGRWLGVCNQALASGDTQRFEYHFPPADRWFEVRVTRVTDSRMAQLFFDITDRKNAEARQAALFDELNHRVKNNLTLVSAVLEMKARASENDEVRDQLLKAVNRVQSIAQVHTALYRGGRTNDVDFAAYLQELCGGIAQSLAQDERIRVQVRAEPAQFSVDLAITLGMIVNELLTNAVKYAYGPTQSGEIEVNLTREGDGMTLVIADAGPGLPPGAEWGAAGLGMRLVRALVGQAKGSLEIRRDGGTAFAIRLPPDALAAR